MIVLLSVVRHVISSLFCAYCAGFGEIHFMVSVRFTGFHHAIVTNLTRLSHHSHPCVKPLLTHYLGSFNYCVLNCDPVIVTVISATDFT